MQESNLKEKTVEEIINEIPREIFHKKFVGGICQTKEFSYLASFWAKSIPVDYKQKIKKELSALGIPSNLLTSDDDLDDIAIEIMNRAIELR